MRTPPITTRALDHYFGVGDARKQALFDINLEIARGSLTILMGPSGSGKTTLLTLIGCLACAVQFMAEDLDLTVFHFAQAPDKRQKRRLARP